jgi:hypothetical protein
VHSGQPSIDNRDISVVVQTNPLIITVPDCGRGCESAFEVHPHKSRNAAFSFLLFVSGHGQYKHIEVGKIYVCERHINQYIKLYYISTSLLEFVGAFCAIRRSPHRPASTT